MDVANIIIAALVPFLSVFMAQQLARRDAKRETAMNAFLKVNKDMQDYRHAYFAHYWNRFRAEQEPYSPQQDKFRELVPQSFRELRDMVTALNNDCMMLGLIFGRRADKMGQKLETLGQMAKVIVDDEINWPFAEYQNRLNQQIVGVSKEIKPPWSSLYDEDLE